MLAPWSRVILALGGPAAMEPFESRRDELRTMDPDSDHAPVNGGAHLCEAKRCSLHRTETRRQGSEREVETPRPEKVLRSFVLLAGQFKISARIRVTIEERLALARIEIEGPRGLGPHSPLLGGKVHEVESGILFAVDLPQWNETHVSGTVDVRLDADEVDGLRIEILAVGPYVKDGSARRTSRVPHWLDRKAEGRTWLKHSNETARVVDDAELIIGA